MVYWADVQVELRESSGDSDGGIVLTTRRVLGIELAGGSDNESRNPGSDDLVLVAGKEQSSATRIFGVERA